MVPNSNILLKLDDRLINYARREFLRSRSKGTKLHSISTMAAFVFTGILFDPLGGTNPIAQFRSAISEGIAPAVAYGGMCFAVLAFTIFAIYQCRAFLSLRREGLNADRNLFFSESAGVPRKFLFYLALFSAISYKVQTYLHPEGFRQFLDRMRFQMRADFMHDATLAIATSIIASIVIVEVVRMGSVKADKWNSFIHVSIVLSLSILFSIIRIITLNSMSGHGIM